MKRIGEIKPLRLPSNAANPMMSLILGQKLKEKFESEKLDQDWLTAFNAYLEKSSELHPDFGVQHSKFASLQET